MLNYNSSSNSNSSNSINNKMWPPPKKKKSVNNEGLTRSERTIRGYNVQNCNFKMKALLSSALEPEVNKSRKTIILTQEPSKTKQTRGTVKLNTNNFAPTLLKSLYPTHGGERHKHLPYTHTGIPAVSLYWQKNTNSIDLPRLTCEDANLEEWVVGWLWPCRLILTVAAQFMALTVALFSTSSDRLNRSGTGQWLLD